MSTFEPPTEAESRAYLDRMRAGLVSEDPHIQTVWQAWTESDVWVGVRLFFVADAVDLEVDEVARIIFTDAAYHRWAAEIEEYSDSKETGA